MSSVYTIEFQKPDGEWARPMVTLWEKTVDEQIERGREAGASVRVTTHGPRTIQVFHSDGTVGELWACDNIPLLVLDEEEKGPGKIEPPKASCEPCMYGNCRGCKGHKVCGHYHAWEGEDEELSFCGKPLSESVPIFCKAPRGHLGDCWASR